MKPKNVSGIILEGIAGTGKTTALKALIGRDEWKDRAFLSSVVLTEHQTLRVLEAKKDAGIAKEDNLSLLDIHIAYLETLTNYLSETDWLERDRSAQKVPFIFERFHLSHAYHHEHLQWDDLLEIDQRLFNLNALVFLFTIEPEDMQERIINDYKKNGWQDYLQTLGKNDREILDHFVKKQNELLNFAEKSKLPVMHINSSELTSDEIVEKIITNWAFLA